MRHRDMYPKTDLLGGYIGDGLPLCSDTPERAFLRRGESTSMWGPPEARESSGCRPKPSPLHVLRDPV